MQTDTNKEHKKMINITPISIFLCLLLLHFTTTAAQPTPPIASPSPAPAPTVKPKPPSITKILQKGKEYNRFVALMKQTEVVKRLETDLNNPNKSQGLTILAPRNKAFSGMKSGALNSLSSDQLSKLVLFHCVQTFNSLSDFQAVTNPLNTEAGDASNGQFMLNVVTTDSQVNFSTGVGHQDATVLGTVYSNVDRQLAVYEVSRLLLPKAIFPVPPFVEAAAPGPAKGPKKDDGGASEGDLSSDGVDGGSDGGGGGGGSTSDGSFLRCGGVVFLVVCVLVVLI